MHSTLAIEKATLKIQSRPGSNLPFQLLKLNAFNCEDHYFRTVADKVGENRSKQCCIAGFQNEAGMHSVTVDKGDLK